MVTKYIKEKIKAALTPPDKIKAAEENVGRLSAVLVAGTDVQLLFLAALQPIRLRS